MKRICEFEPCGRSFTPSRRTQRFCCPHCQISWNNKLKNYRERKQHLEKIDKSKRPNKCQYVNPETWEVCGKSTRRHFLCDAHFALGEQLEEVSFPRRRRANEMDR
jgi:hypothetical protein